MVKGMKAALAWAGFAVLAATAGCSAHASGPSPQELAMQRAEHGVQMQGEGRAGERQPGRHLDAAAVRIR